MKKRLLMCGIVFLIILISGCLSEGEKEKYGKNTEKDVKNLGEVIARTSTTDGSVVAKVDAPVLPQIPFLTTISYITIPVVQGTKVRYTRYGETPSRSIGTELTTTTAIVIPGTRIIKAIAYKEGYNDSDISCYTYKLTGIVEQPILPKSTGFVGSINVKIPCPVGAQVRYTLDSNKPTSTQGILITTSTTLTFTKTTTINAIAFKNEWGDSSISCEVYSKNGKAAMPELTSSCRFSGEKEVVINVLEGTSVRYTTDGTTPSAINGRLITTKTSLYISETTRVLAKSFKTECEDSDTAEGVYTQIQKTESPILPKSAVFTTVSYITIPVVPGTKVRYTRFGETPSATVGTELITTTAILIPGTREIKAVAYKDGFLDSDIVKATYIITGKVSTPEIITSTICSISTSVTIKCNTVGAEIRYTINGDEPSKESNLYVDPIILENSTQIKAKAFKLDWEESTTTTTSIIVTPSVAAISKNIEMTITDVNEIVGFNNYKINLKINIQNISVVEVWGVGTTEDKLRAQITIFDNCGTGNVLVPAQVSKIYLIGKDNNGNIIIPRQDKKLFE